MLPYDHLPYMTRRRCYDTTSQRIHDHLSYMTRRRCYYDTMSQRIHFQPTLTTMVNVIFKEFFKILRQQLKHQHLICMCVCMWMRAVHLRITS